jgi:gephyrin
MSNETLKAAILIVSTTAHKDPSTDSSGEVLNDVFKQEGPGKWEVVVTKIVSDDKLDIQESVKNWSDQTDSPNLIITTGGTGFAIRDITPEVRGHLDTVNTYYLRD